MTLNPYVSPRADQDGGTPGALPVVAAQRLHWAGWWLIMTASCSIAVRVILLTMAVAGIVAAHARRDQESIVLIGQLIGGIIHHVVAITFNVVTLIAGIQLRRLQSYRLVLVGTIFACLPWCSPCYLAGIPFGIWALIALNDKRVKEAFRS